VTALRAAQNSLAGCMLAVVCPPLQCMTTARQLSSPAMDELQRQLNMTNNDANIATL